MRRAGAAGRGWLDQGFTCSPTSATTRRSTDELRFCRQSKNSASNSRVVDMRGSFSDLIHASAVRAQTWAMPPSTKTSLPFMKLLSSDARNATTFATSSSRPIRARGVIEAAKSKKPLT
jgi:hypothetical protein